MHAVQECWLAVFVQATSVETICFSRFTVDSTFVHVLDKHLLHSNVLANFMFCHL